MNGIALGLNDPNKSKFKRRLPTTHNAKELRRSLMTDEELIFNLEEEQVNDLSHSPTFPVNAVSTRSNRNQLAQTGSLKLKSKSPFRPKFRSIGHEINVYKIYY